MMWESVINNNKDTLQKLLKCGVDPNITDANGEPLFFTLIVNEDLESLKMLLDYCDVNTENEDGRTSLMLAIEMDDLETIRVLIKAGARVNKKYNSGKTPLLLALEEGKFRISEYLIKHGSDVNEMDDLGQTALHLVATGQHNDCTKIVKILFHCGYVMKEADKWICPEDLIGNKRLQSKQSKILHKIKTIWKMITREDNVITRGS
ncbi:serine/threonine-protein phosphatase 6 regulatory ankyrin repeat subunit B-like [Ostrea edulis]|uniref:serine/threonine-protein phosphatase 6 regulatory ankyrin repeat subunit B-like n=1 Tax=Ostrea edulis TaxID=37623 RepID=UPI0024AFFC5D|nr:serine/threonine-protein phosphatase 6 regulatory ankyrin repeat subunit B-like [Ostrea edulis]